MRLIDADDLLAEYDRQHEGEPGKARKLIEDAPTIDRPTRSQFKRMAVQLGYEPVVHCKDCKFSRELDKLEKEIYLNNCRACRCPEASQDGYMIVFPEHFCSYGKRRADFVDDNKIGERRTDANEPAGT